jgi:hypothetical protein
MEGYWTGVLEWSAGLECWTGGMTSSKIIWNYSLEALPCQGCLNRHCDAQ